MFRYLPLSVAAIVLAGCQLGQQTGGIVALDGAQAAGMATAFAKVDPSAATRVPCYAAWGIVGGNMQGASQPGILSTVESGIELQSTLQIPACQGIAGNVLMWLARKAPLGNLLP